MIDPGSIDLIDFLITWYGPPGRAATPLPASLEWLPQPLRNWHTLASPWDVRMDFATTMTPPESIEVSDGMAVFMEDGLGDREWAFSADEPDLVFEAEPGDEWERVPENFPEFLVHNAVMNTSLGAPHKAEASHVDPTDMMRVVDNLDEFAFGMWGWMPGYRMFMGDEALAEIVPHGRGTGLFVRLSATTPDRLAELTAGPGIRWACLPGWPSTPRPA
ncbi:hypothetical protein ABT369_55400 [Dactylosporangium sp. NPDC000244]|uniref:hypothetical protein n=1 Tax=Dactylosporangium sp. NPDC000244 TaxID=3154365 RepID=UPI00331ED621